jgi:pimeloyl-ACP methyl ester carboxylesterase
LHGWGCDRNIWRPTVEFLGNSYRIIAVDFAGFGQSQEPNKVWGVEEYTRSIEALAKAEGVENPILIGHSFGGRVSIVYASRNKVQKVMLVDAAGVKPRRSFTYYRKVYTFKLLKRLAPIFLGKARAEQMIQARRAKAGSSDYNQASPMMRRVLSKVVNEDLCHLMPKITVPTLLFWGENDTATPLADAKKMEKLIPDAGLVTVAGAGHFSFLENTPLFLRVAESFLQKEINKR